MISNHPTTFTVDGIDIVFCPMDSPTTSVRLVCGSGSTSDTKPGAAHYLEHLFFKGTDELGAAEVNRKLGRLGRGNAWTSYCTTCFMIDTLPGMAVEAAQLLLDLIEAPRLDEADIETERGPIVEEWQMRQDDGFSFALDACVSETLGLSPIIGTKGSIQSMTRADLVAFCEQNYHRENLALIICGNLSGVSQDSARLVKAVRELKVPCGRPRQIDPPVSVRLAPWDQPKVMCSGHSTEQSVVLVAMPTDGRLMDYRAGYAGGLMDNAIGGGMHSILYQKLREEAGLGYDVGCFALDAPDGLSGVLIAYAMVSPASAVEAADSIRRVIKDLPELLTPDLVDTALANYSFGVATRSQTPAGMAAAFYTHWLKAQDLRGYRGFSEDLEAGAPGRLKAILAQAKRLCDGCVVYILNAPEEVDELTEDGQKLWLWIQSGNEIGTAEAASEAMGWPVERTQKAMRELACVELIELGHDV